MPFRTWKRKDLPADAPQIEKDILSAIDAEPGIHGSTTLTVVLGDDPKIKSVAEASPDELDRLNLHFHQLFDEGYIVGTHYEDEQYDQLVTNQGKIDPAVVGKGRGIQAKLAEQMA